VTEIEELEQSHKLVSRLLERMAGLSRNLNSAADQETGKVSRSFGAGRLQGFLEAVLTVESRIDGRTSRVAGLSEDFAPLIERLEVAILRLRFDEQHRPTDGAQEIKLIYDDVTNSEAVEDNQ
jgi:hypothetical protein